MTISVICPTRNRAELWRSGWLLDSLAAQSRLPDELVIAVDHTEDDTHMAIISRLRSCSFPVTTRILTVEAPRPEPLPASGLPDNCLIHNATCDVILHVDDDIKLPARFLAQVESHFETLPNISVWYLMTFVDDFGKSIDFGADWRLDRIRTHKWQPGPGGLVKPEPASACATGAIWATATSTLRAIGGNDVANCGYHNSDTMLGHRLSRFCTGGTYISGPNLEPALHLGYTWHMQHRKDLQALSKAYNNQTIGPTIANGGPKYWESDFWKSAYTVSHVHTLTRSHPGSNLSRVMLRPGAKVQHHADRA